MENNLNKNFTLTKEQIEFIDNGFLNKKKELKDVVEELVKQPNNDFQEKDVEQIMELYIEIKRLERPKRRYSSRNKWTQAELEILINALEKKIKEKGKNISIRGLAIKLHMELLKSHSEEAIDTKMRRLLNRIQEYGQIKSKQPERRNININQWTQAELEILINALKKEIKEKGKNISIKGLARKLHTGPLKSHSVASIETKIRKLSNRVQEYEQIKLNQLQNQWTQAELEIIINALKKNKDISDKKLADKLQKGPLKHRSKKAIEIRIWILKKQSKYTPEKNKITENTGAENNNCMSVDSQNNNEINEDLVKKIKEVLDKCVNDTEQLNNAENHLAKINTSENNKLNKSLYDLFGDINSTNQISSVSTEKNDKKEDPK